MLCWVHLSPYPKRHLDWFSCFCPAYSRQSLYFTVGAHFSLNCPFPWGYLDPHLIPDSSRSHDPNSISIGSAVFAQVTAGTMGYPFLPSKLLLPMGGSGPPSGTTLVLNPNGILIGSAVFAGSLLLGL